MILIYQLFFQSYINIDYLDSPGISVLEKINKTKLTGERRSVELNQRPWMRKLQCISGLRVLGQSNGSGKNKTHMVKQETSDRQPEIRIS